MLHQPGLGGEMNDNDGGAPADLIDVANTVMAMVRIRHPLDRSLPPSWRRLLTRGADRGRSEASPRNDGDGAYPDHARPEFSRNRSGVT